MVNGYFFAAFSFVWAIFVAYVWVLARRQAQLRKGLADLKRKLQEASLSAPASKRLSPLEFDLRYIRNFNTRRGVERIKGKETGLPWKPPRWPFWGGRKQR